MNPKLTARFILGQSISLASVGIILFWTAGRIDWWAAWAVIGVWLVWFITEFFVIQRYNPGLLAERLAPPKEAKSWDRALLSSIRLVELARYILAGLDQRYGWTDDFPVSAQIVALVVCLLSTALFAWAMASNSFFSQVVRIQTERGHTVATGGPYRFVRHPGYTAMILFELALSTLLGSWWAIALGGICVILFVLRTSLEDRSLLEELPGYAIFAQRVRYRLIPGIW